MFLNQVEAEPTVTKKLVRKPKTADTAAHAESLHCGFCQTNFTGDIKEHQKKCWTTQRIKSLPSLLVDLSGLKVVPNCPPGRRLCGNCVACRQDACGYIIGHVRL